MWQKKSNEYFSSKTLLGVVGVNSHSMSVGFFGVASKNKKINRQTRAGEIEREREREADVQ